MHTSFFDFSTHPNAYGEVTYSAFIIPPFWHFLLPCYNSLSIVFQDPTMTIITRLMSSTPSYLNKSKYCSTSLAAPGPHVVTNTAPQDIHAVSRPGDHVNKVIKNM